LVRLPATRVEAETIARFGGARSRKVLDFEASRRRVLSGDLSDATVLHFASHALINPQHPALSGIILSLVDARGEPVDGFIRVHDLYRLHLRADLVVLSACRTSIGTEMRGEGLVGLVSGFSWAGAPRVIASFWDVKDQATAAFMKHFYRALLADRLPAGAALRRAQLAVRSDPRWGSPYYWGAFTLHGQWK
ncbi:MAG TPA: CHAT domain-containing protein, partial [Thermoanaerobaculia bacterium]|nr:CHAT domain-containing protein [Thermoanaerobaculia bacterium]